MISEETLGPKDYLHKIFDPKTEDNKDNRIALEKSNSKKAFLKNYGRLLIGKQLFFEMRSDGQSCGQWDYRSNAERKLTVHFPFSR